MPVIIYIRYFIISNEMHYECTNVLISRNVLKTRVLILTQTIFFWKANFKKPSILKVLSLDVLCSVN